MFVFQSATEIKKFWNISLKLLRRFFVNILNIILTINITTCKKLLISWCDNEVLLVRIVDSLGPLAYGTTTRT